ITKVATPHGHVFVHENITICWSLSDPSTAQAAVLKITHVPDGEFTIIDKELALNTLQKNWVVSVCSGTYYFSIIDNDGEVRSDNFNILESILTASFLDVSAPTPTPTNSSDGKLSTTIIIIIAICAALA
ncbi:7790_t:CDS:2, partial [Acaulospora colombiana]